MKIITIEEHTVDPVLGELTREKAFEEAPYMSEAMTPGMPAYVEPGVLTDLGAGRLAEMDKHGIDMQILSHSNSPQWLPPGEAVSLTREANDRLAEAVKARPDRFGAFAALPWTDPEAAAAELERAVTKLGFQGALLTGRPGDGFLDDPRYSPVLAAASALEAPIYIHPGVPIRSVQEVYYAGLKQSVSASLSLFGWGWHAEPGVQLIRLILAGVFEKFPKLQLIAGHWGEMVPFFLGRLDKVMPPKVTGLARSITEYFANHIYVSPSGMFFLPNLLFILQTLGADRIIYSVDYPYIGYEGAREFLENAPICQADKEKIAHGNAERLFKMTAKPAA